MKLKVFLLIMLGTALSLHAELKTYIVDSTSPVPVLPNSKIDQMYSGNQLRLVLAQNEVSGAAFVVNSNEPYNNFLVKAQDLKNSSGKIIPADALDVKVVKCWYQGATAWWGIQSNVALGLKKDDASAKVLVPELMLHDEQLIKVDHAAKKNYLRLSKSSGAEYVDISDDSIMQKTGSGNWPIESYPVFDAPKLLPINLPANENRLFIVTYHAPKNIEPGIYSGNFIFDNGNKNIGSIKVEIEILPFQLAKATTNYDLTKDYVVSLYYHSIVGIDPRSGNLHPYRRSEKQIETELKNMALHGVTNPNTGQASLFSDFTDERNRTAWHKLLKMRKEAGFDNSEIFFCNNPYLNLGFNKNYKGTSPEEIEQFLIRARAVMDWIRSGTGENTQVYFYGLDEAEGERLENQKKAFKALHEAGGKTWVSGYKASKERPGNFALAGDELDVLNAAFYPEKAEAAKWHSAGKRVFCYSNPQSGPENPDMHRRNYGLALYLRNYDGICNFKYQSLFGDPWNDFDSSSWRDHTYIYPTQDGVIDTIAWEGFREGVNDVRYASTLQLAISEALKSGTTEQKKIAAEAKMFLSKLRIKDYIFNKDDKWIEQKPNLNKVRNELIVWILKLQNTKKQGGVKCN